MRRLPLVALFIANAVSLTGSVLTLIAIPWFVLQTTGSAARAGLTAFASALAVVIASLLGGALVDRMGHRRTSILGDLTSGTAVALVPVLYYTIGLSFWQLLVLVFFANVFDAPGTTARTSLVPTVAESAGVSLERASATLQAVQRGARLIGAPLAGALIAILGASRLLWLDAATFGFSALLIGLAISSPAVSMAPSEDTAASGGYLQQVREGFHFIGQDRLIRAIVLTVMVTNFLDAPLFSVIMPVYAMRVLGSAIDLGLMVSAFGGGALIGALGFGVVGHLLPRRVVFVACFIVLGLPFWLLASLPPFPVILVALVVSGVASGPINPIIYTVVYERVPRAMLGRVFSAVTSGAFLAIPLGVLIAGYLLDAAGIQITMIGVAVSYLVVTMSLTLNPAISKMDRASTGKAFIEQNR